MNKYFGTATHRRSKTDYAKNLLLGNVRSAILRGTSFLLATQRPEYYHELIRTEFPDVPLRIVKIGLEINKKD